MSYSEFFVNPFYLVTLNNASDYRTIGYIGDRGFRSAGPAAWNSLSDELHRIILHYTDLIYLNAVSKLYSSREHIVTNFVSAPGRLL